MNRCLIKVTGNYEKFINKLIYYKINYNSLVKISEKEFKLIISYNDYQKLKNILVNYSIDIIRFYGPYKYKRFLLNYWHFLITLIVFLLIIFFTHNVIVSINVVTSNAELRNEVTKALEEYGIKRLIFKKKFVELEQVKKNVLERLKDRVEWLEIKENGMSYIINVEERIIKIAEKQKYCNILAKKSGIIKSIISSSGQITKSLNDYVNEGEIIISGQIKNNELTVRDVCASGNVYAEVWYNQTVKLDLNYQEEVKTNHKRYNLSYEKADKKVNIFNTKFKNYNVYHQKLFNILGIGFYFTTEYETKIVDKKYNEKEAIAKAIDIGYEKLDLTLKSDEGIIKANILNYSIDENKITVNIFYAVKEQIGVKQFYELNV